MNSASGGGTQLIGPKTFVSILVGAFAVVWAYYAYHTEERRVEGTKQENEDDKTEEKCELGKTERTDEVNEIVPVGKEGASKNLKRVGLTKLERQQKQREKAERKQAVKEEDKTKELAVVSDVISAVSNGPRASRESSGVIHMHVHTRTLKIHTHSL
jgi:hypothetical protein